MKNLKLLPHNQQAVDKTMFHFKSGAQRAAIIHPTGTGKSYCIAAIAQQFNKVAVIAPNKYVLAQIKNVCGNSVEIYTYSKITKISPTGYDLIVIDELHRMGARTWEVGIKNLLQVNPNAKVLGTTATPIRYLDNERDMAEDYFKGDVISQIELVDAMVGGILPVPHYVVGYYSLEFLNEILEVPRPELVQKALEEKVEAIRENWNKSNGVPGIISRHISQDTKRIIIFFKDILDLQNSKQTVIDWFIKAGMNVYKTYEVHSKSQTNLNDFEQDGYEGTKLLFCVNMLNEGVHVSGVDAIVFLRATWSRNIWFQQMGRVMDAGKKKAVILDLVANARSIEDLAYIKNLQKLYQQKVQSLGGQVGYVGGIYEIEDFDIIDYTEDIIKLLESLRKRTSEECLIELYNFIKKEKRLPLIKESKIYYTLGNLRKNIYDKDYPELVQEIKDLCNELKIDLYIRQPLKECLINLLNFIKKEKRLPSTKERKIYNTLGNLRKHTYDKDYPELVLEIKDLCDELGISLYIRIRQTSKECLINLLNFLKKEKRLPFCDKEPKIYNTLGSLRIATYYKNHSELVQEIKDLCNELKIDLYVRRPIKECLIDLLNFIKKEKRLPSTKEYKIYDTFRKLCNGKYDKDYPELIQEIRGLCNELRISLYIRVRQTSKECLIDFLNFIKKEKRLPFGSKESNLYHVLKNLRKSKYDEDYPELVKEIKDLCNKLNLPLNIKED